MRIFPYIKYSNVETKRSLLDQPCRSASGGREGLTPSRIQGMLITATFILTYAQSPRTVFDPIVGTIAKSFVANPELQF